MGLLHYLRRAHICFKSQTSRSRTRGRVRSRPDVCRPFVELLEDRLTPARVTLSGVPSWQAEGPAPILGAQLSTGSYTPASPQTAVGAIESVVSEAHTTTGPNGTITTYTIYAGTVNGGVWRADNVDPTQLRLPIAWRPLTDRQPSLAVASMAIDPTDPTGNTLWVGTGSLSSSYPAGGRAHGLLKTTDGGQTWTQLDQTVDGLTIVSVVPSADTVAGNQVVLIASLQGGVERSTDGGKTFLYATLANTGKPLSGTATDLIADPANPHRFYAALANKGVFESDDDGGTWIEIDGALAQITKSPYLELAATWNGANTDLYVVTSQPATGNNKVYGGQLTGALRTELLSVPVANPSWLPIGASNSPSNALVGFAGHFFVIGDPTNPNVIYVSGWVQTLYRVDATAGSWTQLSGGSLATPHDDQRSLAFLNATTLLDVNDGGIYALTNPAAPGTTDHWYSLNATLENTELFQVAYDSHNGMIFGGAQDTGSSVQSDGLAWSPVPGTGGDGGAVAVDNSGSQPVYYTFSDLAPGRTLLTGVSSGTAQGTYTSLPLAGLNLADAVYMFFNAGRKDQSFPIAVDTFSTTTPEPILLGGAGLTGVYESLNRGDTVTEVTPTGMTGNVSAITYASPLGAAYLGTNKGQLFVRALAIAPFTVMTLPTGWRGSAQQIVVDPADYHIAYVLNNTGQVWRTTDAGASATGWSLLSGNLYLTQTDTIALYGSPSGTPGGGVLLVGGMGGVERLTLQPGTFTPQWALYGSGLPDVLVSDLHYIPPNSANPANGDLLLAATYGRGAWEIPNASATIFSQGVLDVEAASSTIVLRLDPNNAPYIQVLVNNQIQFEERYALLQTIYINEYAGNDTIDIQDVPSSLSVVAYNDNVVNVGKAGSMQGIQGALTIGTVAGSTQVNVDDSSGTVSQAVSLADAGNGFGSITGLGLGTITYQYDSTATLTVRTGIDDNAIDVQATGENTTLIDSGTRKTLSPNTITVGCGGNVGSILGTLNIEDPSSLNTITVDSSAEVGQTAFLGTLGTNPVDFQQNGDPWGSISGLSPGTINYEYGDTSSLTLKSGPGDTINISGTGTTTNLVGSALIPQQFFTTVNVGEGGSVQGILGVLSIDNPVGSNVLTVDDSGDSSNARSVTLGTFTRAPDSPGAWGYIGGLAPAHINYEYADTNSFTVLTGDAADTIHVLATGVPTTLIDSGPGKVRAVPNAITIGNGGTVQGIAAILNIENPASLDMIVVDDSNDKTGETATFTTMGANLADSEQNADAWGTINGLGMTGTVNYEYADASKVTVNGGKGGNTFAIQGTGCPLIVNGGTGGATFNVGSTSNSLDAIQGAVTLHGQGGAYLVNINDQGNLAANTTYTLAATTLARSGAATITYNGETYAQSQVALNAGAGANVIDVNGTAGNDTFTYIYGGSTGNQFNVLGTSTVSWLLIAGGAGGNNLIRLGSISTGPMDMGAHGGSLGKILGIVETTSATTFRLVVDDSSDPVSYSDVVLGNTSLSNLGPTGVGFIQNLGLLAYTVYGGKGNNVYNVASLPAYFTAETLSTGPGQDVVNLSVGDAYSYGLTIHGQGKTAVNVNDQTVTDTTTYAVASTSLTRTTLTAIQGYAPEVLTVTYDGVAALAINGGSGVNTLDYSSYSGPVTVDVPLGVATGLSGGISNIQDVTGGSGDDLFVGDGGNVLTGGTGRNILMAGGKPGTLIGNAGEDLLVGGTTNYDTNLAALEAIMAEWDNRGTPYATRVQHLLNGGGLNGNVVLGATNFTNNGGGNTLTGGNGLDLFYGIKALDSNDWCSAVGEVFIENASAVSFAIDARGLAEPALDLDNSVSVSTTTPGMFVVPAGTHTLSDPYAPDSQVAFTVAADGTVSYDSSLNNVLGGQTTNTLVVHGAKIMIDATKLSDTVLQVDTETGSTTGAPFPMILLPGTHSVSEPLDPSTAANFTIGDDSTVSYDSSLNGIFGGQRSTTLVVKGVTMTINAQALSDPNVQIDTYIQRPTANAFRLALLPGSHSLQAQYQAGTAISFSLDSSGNVAFDSSLSGILGLQGSNTLVVAGETLGIDATAISSTVSSFSINEFIGLSTTQVQTLQVLPGTYVYSDSTLQFSFALTTTDGLTYPSNLAGQVSANGDTLAILF